MDISYAASAPRKRKGQPAKDVRDCVGILTIKLWSADAEEEHVLSNLRRMLDTDRAKFMRALWGLGGGTIDGAEIQEEMTQHERNGNCTDDDTLYGCAICRPENLCDVCHDHDEPRGECSACSDCQACNEREEA